MTKRDLTRIGQLMQCQIWAIGFGALMVIGEWLIGGFALAGSLWFGYWAYDGLKDELDSINPHESRLAGEDRRNAE